MAVGAFTVTLCENEMPAGLTNWAVRGVGAAWSLIVPCTFSGAAANDTTRIASVRGAVSVPASEIGVPSCVPGAPPVEDPTSGPSTLPS